VIADRVGELVASERGPRLLRVSLAETGALMDPVPEAVVLQCASLAKRVVDLTAEHWP